MISSLWHAYCILITAARTQNDHMQMSQNNWMNNIILTGLCFRC